MKYLLALLSAVFLSGANAFTTMPQDGLWSLDSESSLAVGRAFNLETAGNLTVITFYNYNATGAPTFYVGAGALSTANAVTVGFSEPRGGTCLGCTQTSGSLLSSPGSAVFEFTSSTTGFVTLPRESRKAISKGNVGFATGQSALLGGWAFTYMTGATNLAFADYALLTTLGPSTATGAGLVANAGLNIACEQQVTGTLAGYVICIKLLSSGNTDKSMLIKWYGHHMDGVWIYGPGTYRYIFTARRISYGGDQYDMKREATPAPGAMDAMRNAMEQAIATTPLPSD